MLKKITGKLPYTHMGVLVSFCAADGKLWTKTTWRRDLFGFHFQATVHQGWESEQRLKAGNLEWELKQRTVVSWVTFTYCSYTSQALLSRHGTAHRGVGLPISSRNQEHDLHSWLQDNPRMQFLSWGSFFPVVSGWGPKLSMLTVWHFVLSFTFER